MTIMSRIKEHMEVIGADGVHVGTVDRIEENRIKLTKADSGRVGTKAIITISTEASWPTWKATRSVSPRTVTSR